MFYDQGIGIPKSLPASTWAEHTREFFREYRLAKSDANIIKAACAIRRSRTKDESRGKGISDMIEFVRQRGDGYISIISKRGLYKLNISGKDLKGDLVESDKTVQFDCPLEGTMIIWNVRLEG